MSIERGDEDDEARLVKASSIQSYSSYQTIVQALLEDRGAM